MPSSSLYHLVGTETTNLDHPDRREFSPPFSRLSPYTACEILDLSDAQQTRYWEAYNTCKLLLRDLGIFPQKIMGKTDKEAERRIEQLDDFEEGYPNMTLLALVDVVSAFLHVLDKQEGNPRLYYPPFAKDATSVMRRVNQVKSSSAVSWRALRARLFRLGRMNVFDSRNLEVHPMDYSQLTRPGAVSIIDLSDMESADIKNLVIADILRGVEEAQENAFDAAVKSGESLPRTLVITEEAHEFLSSERIRRMPNLFETVSRIAKRGRKRCSASCS